MSRPQLIKLIMAIVGVILALVIVLQNIQKQAVKFLFVSVEMPLAGLLFTTLVIGFVLGWLGPSLLRLRR